MRPALSVIFPAFNEADNIAPAIRRAYSVLGALGIKGEVIVVDDGSADETASVAARYPVQLIRHPENLGYGSALRSGFAAAEGERVFFTDADQQFDLAELEGLMEAAQDVDIAVGYRQVRRDPVHRRVNAWAWGELVGRLFDLEVRDINCAFKVLRREVLETLTLQSTGAFINTELLCRAQAAGMTMVEIPVGHYARTTGQATGARPGVIYQAFRELASLHTELRQGGSPTPTPRV